MLCKPAHSLQRFRPEPRRLYACLPDGARQFAPEYLVGASHGALSSLECGAPQALRDALMRLWGMA